MEIVSVRAKVLSDSSGAVAEIPILLTDAGALHSLVDYLLWREHDRSRSWMRKVVHDVALMLAYMKVNAGHYRDPESLFHGFVQRLYSGTVGADGIDPSGLYWLPHDHGDISKLITRLTDFSNWMSERQGTRAFNPLHAGSTFDEMIAAAAWMARRDRAFLGHAWQSISNSRRSLRRSTLPRRLPKVSVSDDSVAFPEQHFEDLLFHGFRRRSSEWQKDPGKRLNLRDCLITLLMHGAGLRLSECFHLWLSDVRPHPLDPTTAQVRIHHPSLGDAPDDWFDERGNPIKCNRATYLAGKHAMRPRTEIMNKHYAGWKDPSLDGKYYMEAYWFDPRLGNLFMYLWKSYLRELVDIPRFHPYAFVTQERSSAGEMYSMDNYKQAHARAVRRIGLIPSKSLGTTPHGHRHAYGRRLMRSGVTAQIKQKALHHKSISSQLIYSVPNATDVSNALNEATQVLNSLAADGRHVKPSFSIEKLLAYGFEDIDPDGLFSGPTPKLR